MRTIALLLSYLACSTGHVWRFQTAYERVPSWLKEEVQNSYQVAAFITLLNTLSPSVGFKPNVPSISWRMHRQTGMTRHTQMREQFSNRGEHWMNHLKFGGTTPSFDVIAKTVEYTALPAYRAFRLRDIPKEYYSDDYVFRGAIVGPITRTDLVQTNTAFELEKAFPDLERQAFGFCVDPENPYRVLYFERWTATHEGELKIPALPSLPPTGRKSISPAFPFSVVWDPNGKIIYEHLATAVDRFEGNTKGKVAVFGLLETAGLPLANSVGDQVLASLQKMNRFFNGPAQTHSKEEDVPKWWKSEAVGAEWNDV